MKQPAPPLLASRWGGSFRLSYSDHMNDQPCEQVTRAPYRREPYVRATLDDVTTVDGKATAWTQDSALVAWYDPDTPSAVVAGVPVHMHTAWIPAEHVRRIKRSESSWIDPDDLGHD